LMSFVTTFHKGGSQIEILLRLTATCLRYLDIIGAS
jgi:hypothetical protein